MHPNHVWAGTQIGVRCIGLALLERQLWQVIAVFSSKSGSCIKELRKHKGGVRAVCYVLF